MSAKKIRNRVVPVVALLGASTTLAACSYSPVAAQIGSQVITQSQLNTELNALLGNSQFIKQLTSASTGSSVENPLSASPKSVLSTAFVDKVLQRRITFDLIKQALAKSGTKVGSDQVTVGTALAITSYGGPTIFDAFPKSYQLEVIDDYAALITIEGSLTKTDFSLPTLQSYYNSHLSDYVNICAAHILSSSASAANSILAKLNSGSSFPVLARTSSADSTTAQNGGYIGCALPSQFSSSFGASFANEIKTGPINKPLPIVAVGSGYSIPLVTSRTQLSFSQSLAAIATTKLGTTGGAVVNAFVAGAAKSANVSVNPQYGTFSASVSGLNIAAPATPAP
ncbi:MAG: peptidylprolyl isomerase [Actinomycetota bacterium]|nr:peptidylprolyl isomerase [Actinomycetota bacterium]